MVGAQVLNCWPQLQREFIEHICLFHLLPLATAVCGTWRSRIAVMQPALTICEIPGTTDADHGTPQMPTPEPCWRRRRRRAGRGGQANEGRV